MENAKQEKEFNLVDYLFDFTEMLVFAVIITMIVFTFIGRVTVVSGRSMEQTLSDRDVLVVTNLGDAPKYGDIVVCQVPGVYDKPIVKRVIATEGQTVDIDFDNWIVTVDGKPVAVDADGNPAIEEYVNYQDGYRMLESNFDFPLTVEEGKVFLMGDNRNRSSDSRSFGCVDARCIFGKALYRIKPFNKIGLLK